MWKAPRRPTHEVTQAFNDGIVTVYNEKDSAQPGYAPVPEWTQKAVLRYEERRLGLQRYYTAKQNQVQVKRVLRCPLLRTVSTQDIAKTENGTPYRVELIQLVPDMFPPAMDLTLVDLVANYGGER